MIGEGRRSCGWAREGKGDGRGSSIRGRRGLLTGMSANKVSHGLPLATPQQLGDGLRDHAAHQTCAEVAFYESISKIQPVVDFTQVEASSDAYNSSGQGRAGP